MSPASSRLIVRTGPNPGMVFDLTKEVTMLGRDVTNDIVIGDAEISRQHSRITRTPGGMVLEDLGSTNGTFVNGDRLVSPRVLASADLVGMGENVTMTYESSAPEAAATVLGVARGTPAPRTSAPPVAAAPGVATPMPAQAARPAGFVPPEEEAPARGGGRKWLLAGCGCLILLVVCVGLLYVLDSYYPDVLYAPLRMLGITP
ncbi:MAG TPA: FHA domain-containing protein [Anaerolineales bacterium]|nr:FHA domain-containing protein [Anaerolineales bacterium]